MPCPTEHATMLLSNLLKRLRRQVSAPSTAQAAPAAPGFETAERLIAEGNRAEDAGDMRTAFECYRKAVETAPDYAKAHLNLGIGLEAIGETEAARKSYESALAIDFTNTYANYNLGKLVFTRGELPEAERLLRRAVDSKPDFPEAQVVLASLLEAQGNFTAAATTLELALHERPDYFGALCNYAAVLRKLDRPDEAESALRRAVAIDPGNSEANYQLGTLLMARGKLEEAEIVLLQGLNRAPDSFETHSALFDLYHSQGKLTVALAELEAALELRPDWVEALFNLGLILKRLARLDEADIAFRRALAIDPAYMGAHRMLGSIHLNQCRVDEALQLYQTGIEHCPDAYELESAKMFALNCSDDIEIDEFFDQHAAFGARLEKSHPARFEFLRDPADPERRLRIGYVSAELRYHVVTLFLTPLIEHHDRSAFEVYIYSTGDTSDEYTRALQARADVWRDVSSSSETELADLIHRDRIDILIDLAGHSGVPHLSVFAQRPAPVQATWLGYLNTTGLTRIQYRISDSYSDPPGLTDRYHTETLVRLPDSQWCYRPFLTVDCSDEAPFTRNGHVTFGSFNQAVKLSPSVRSLWAGILTQLPDSRLVVIGLPEGRAWEELYSDMERAGVGRERITLVPYVSLEDYFRWYNAVDIALDTTPYSGGTTTCDALWMGVPVITVPGVRPSSRSAASILTTVGLTSWIASAPEDYVRRAVEFASERTVVAGLRSSLRSMMQASPLMDEKQFTQDMENAYRRIWRSWCSEGSA